MTQPFPDPWAAPPRPRLRTLGVLLRALLVLDAVALVAAGGLRAWWLSGGPESEWTPRVDAGVGVLVALTGLVWLIWQFRAARGYSPARLRRSPGWHVASWLIPVLAWWWPWENIADLWRLAVGRLTWWVRAWWLGWVAGSLLTGVGAALAGAAGDARSAAWTVIVGDGVLVAAAAAAFALVGVLGRAVEAVHDSSGVSPLVTPPVAAYWANPGASGAGEGDPHDRPEERRP